MGHRLISTLQKKAEERFHTLGWPKQKQEAFQYLPLAKIILPQESAPRAETSTSQITQHFLPKCAAHLVFINGHFEESLSDLSLLPKSCIVLPFQKAVNTYALILQNRTQALLKDEQDPFAALNGARHGEGLFLYLPPGVELQAPLHILSILSSTSLMAPRIQLFLGANAKLDLIRTHLGFGMTFDYLDAVLERGSKLNLVEQSNLEQSSSWLFSHLRGLVKKDASLKSFSYSEGNTRQSIKIKLSETGANAELKGLSLLQHQQQAHAHILVEHQAESCTSRQHIKCALKDKSRSSIEGKIYVHPIAQKTQAYQLSQNLLLSNEAAAHAKPNLEIFADDVKASHGATFSQLKEDELFYLQTRGLSYTQAKELLLKGFCQELIDSIDIPAALPLFRESLL
jgi:Fe-S cluster assembly protein SufD